MSSPLPPGEPLQFDEADYSSEPTTGPSCAACAAPIHDHYYETAGQIVCEPCRDRMAAAFLGGSGTVRLVKATISGSLAALLGAALYHAIVRATDMNIGLVAIVVGLMVGGAVRSGSNARGGWIYQLLALFLTYTAIVGTLAPFVLGEFAAEQEQVEQEAKEDVEAQARLLLDESNQDAVDEEAKAQAEAAAPPDAPAPDARVEPGGAEAEVDVVVNDPPPTPGHLLLVGVVLIAVCYSFPVFMAVESPISGLIYGFALWEAWKINRKAVLTFSGPYHVLPPDAIIHDDDESGDDQDHDDHHDRDEGRGHGA